MTTVTSANPQDPQGICPKCGGELHEATELSRGRFCINYFSEPRCDWSESTYQPKDWGGGLGGGVF